jgi:hypothetical protein
MIIFDIECFKNFFSIILKKNNDIFKYILFENKELEISKDELINLIQDETLVGFNNFQYDNQMLDYLIENKCSNLDLKILNDSMIGTKDSTYLIRKRYLKNPSIYNSIDLFNRNPINGSLKVYEHYKRLNNISESPISFEDLVKFEDIAEIIQYNIDDVIATEMLFDDVKPLLDSLDDLIKEYEVPCDLKSLKPGKIVDEFFKSTINPTQLPDEIIIDLNQVYDFTIKDKDVNDHLNYIKKYSIKTYDSHTIKSEIKVKKNNIINDDIVEKCNTDFIASILNANIKFGIGGLHSIVQPLDLKSDNDYVLIDCDVNGMYPTVIIKQKIAPFYYSDDVKNKFFKIYSELIQKRTTLKAAGSSLEESYKLILNTLTGKFKEIYSVLYDPSCHVKTCVYAQYFLFSVLENISQYIDTICQVNTDGFSLYVKRENVQYIKDYLNTTPEIQWKVKEFKRFISKDCNNYIALTVDNEVKTKGGTFNLDTFSIPQIIKKSLIDNLLFDKNIEDSINNCNDMYDFLYFAKPQKKNLSFNDKPLKNSVIRFCKVIKDGGTIKSNGKQIANGTNALIQNIINDDDLINLDRQFYINETKKWVFTVKGSEHNNVIKLFGDYGIKLCGKTKTTPKDGIILFKGNANNGKELYNYETVGIDMIEYPQLMYVDIDHIDDKHREVIDLCKNANTIYSSSDLNSDSYRFFFLNNTDIIGQYIWLNSNNETSFEIWNQVKNKVSISGVKQKDINGNILENYIINGTELKPLPIEIYNWVKSHSPDNIKGIAKKPKLKNPEITYDKSDNMTNLFNLMNDSNTRLTTKTGYGKVIFFKNKPDWFTGGGEWRSTTLGIFPILDKVEFDIFISGYKNSFDDDCIKYLKGLIQPFIDQINSKDNTMVTDDKTSENINESIKPVDIDNYNNDDDDDYYTENILRNSPKIPIEIYNSLPVFLKDMCFKFTDERERDIFFLSLITVLSSVLDVSGIYYKQRIFPNIFVFVMANAGSGKSAIKYALDLLFQYKKDMKDDYRRQVLAHTNSGAKTNPPKEKDLRIAGDSSVAILCEKLERNDGKGLIFETEADSIVESFKHDWGNYSSRLRDAFQHEEITVDRQTYSIRIDQPRISCMVSGTPNQMLNLIKSSENGLFSRFTYYTFESDSKFKNPFENNEDLSAFFKSKSGYLSEIIDYYKNNPTNYVPTIDKGLEFELFFNKLNLDLKLFHDDDLVGVVNRIGTQTFKIISTIKAIMDFENNDFSNLIDDNIVDNVLKLMTILTKHMQIIHNNLSKNENVVIKSNPREKLISFIMSQKDVFRRELILVQGENMKISPSTSQRVLKTLIESNKIIKSGKLFYQVNKNN